MMVVKFSMAITRPARCPRSPTRPSPVEVVTGAGGCIGMGLGGYEADGDFRPRRPLLVYAHVRLEHAAVGIMHIAARAVFPPVESI